MQIDDYMRNKKLPAAMREKVKDSFHLQHSNGKLYDENEILEMLSPTLRREIKLFNGRELTIKVPLLSSVTNKHFAEEMSTVIEPMISFQNEVVIRENTTGDEMYFISSGVVEIFLAGTRNSAYVAIGDGCVSKPFKYVHLFLLSNKLIPMPASYFNQISTLGKCLYY